MSTAAGLLARGRSALMQTVAQWQLGAPTSQLWHAVGGAGSVASFHTTQPCEARLRMRGTVVSDKAQKSVVVAVERIYKHPVVKKSVKVRNKFMAHDELDQYKVPLSPPPSGRALLKPRMPSTSISRTAFPCRWETRSGLRSTARSAAGSASWYVDAT